MVRLGLIRNPKSTRNTRGRGDMREQAARMLGFYFAEPATPADLAEVLADFARNEVGIVVIDGGDGTVREVLTALPVAYGTELPAVSILAAGKTNLIAADVGTSGYGEKGFWRLVEDARKGRLGTHIRRRPVLEARWDDGSHAPVRGMFMGAAAFTTGTALAQNVHASGLNHGPAVAATILGTLYRTLFGSDPDRMLDGEPMTIVADGDNSRRQGHRFLFLATTLHRLVLGLWPFWGAGDRPIRYLDIAAYPERLPRAVVPLLRGRPTEWMLADGYHSAVASEIRMELTHDFIMDGEVFSPGPGRVVRLSAPTTIDFVVP
ncbi:MAG: hypothetical protein RLY86_75 [Pseudomonadota bacterium]|jgi:hypothetical protein